MKKLFLVLFLFAGISSLAQDQQYLGTTKSTIVVRRGMRVDTLFKVPMDTIRLSASDTGAIAYKGGLLYTFNKITPSTFAWEPIQGVGGGGGGSADVAEGDFIVITGTSTKTISVDTASLPKDTIKLRKNQLTFDASNRIQLDISRSHQELRAKAAVTVTADTATIFESVINGVPARFIYDPNDASSVDDSVMVIVSAGKRLKRVYDYVDPAWWGAKPNDAIEDSYAIQRAIDFAIAHSAKPVVKFTQSGNYYASDLVVAKYVAGEPTFVTLTIEGVAAGIDDPFGGVVLYNNFAAKCDSSAGIHIQQGRNIVLKNLIFRGPVPSPTGNVYERTDADWTQSGGISNGRYNPTCAIDIDGFVSTITGTDRYPHVARYYTNTGAGGTSSVLMDNCVFYDYIVGLMESPSGLISNGDNITMKGGYAYNVRSLWAAGQTQSRANVLDGMYIVGMVGTVINGIEYGLKTGTLPHVMNSSLNACKYLYANNSQFSDISFDNCYGEENWSLGLSMSNGTVTFTNAKLHFRRPDSGPATYAAPLMCQGAGVVNIIGGRMEWVDNLWYAPLVFDVPQVNINGTLLRTGIPFNANNDFEKVSLTGITYARGASEGVPLTDNLNVSEASESSLDGSYLLPGNRVITDSKVSFENTGTRYEKTFLETQTITINTTTKTATFTTSNAGRWKVGDVVISNTGFTYTNTIYSATGWQYLGWVSNITGTTVTLSYIPQGIVTGTSYNLYLARIPRFTGRHSGDLTSGSNTITNVKGLAAYVVGERIKGVGIPAGARVTASTSTTITMSMNATATNTLVDLFDAPVKAKSFTKAFAYSGSTYHWNEVSRYWARGDEVANDGGEAGVTSYVCTSPGLIGIAQFAAGGAGGVSQAELEDSLKAIYTLQSPLISIDSTVQVGTIYDKTSWSDLTDFNAGSAYSISSTKIHITSGAGGAVLELPNATMLDQQRLQMDFKYTSLTSSNDYGLGFGWLSIGNPAQSKLSAYAYLDVHSGADFGKAIIVVETNGSPSSIISTTAIPAISNNDLLRYVISDNAGVFTFTATNITTGQTSSVSGNVNWLAGTGVSHNTAKISVFANNTDLGTVTSTSEISRIAISSVAPKGAKAVVIGNSITHGVYSADASSRYGAIAHFVISAGSGDITSSALAHVREVWQYLQPQNVFLMIGGNDIAFGISSATWQSNLTKIHDTLVAHGIGVYWLLATPRNGTNITPLNTWITTNYPGAYIDTYTPLWSGTGTGLSATYNSGDGTHPNAAGQALIGNTIINSTLYRSIADGAFYLSYSGDPGLNASSSDLAIPNIAAVKKIAGVSNSGVTPGSYTNADITVDITGRVTAASNGSTGGGSYSGTGTNTFLNKWTGATTFGNSLIYDNGTRVGIGTTPTNAATFQMRIDQNAFTGLIAENHTAGASSSAGFKFATGDPGTSDYYISQFVSYGASTTPYGAIPSNSTHLYSAASNGIIFMADNATAPIVFAAGGNSESARISSAGNFHLNGSHYLNFGSTDGSGGYGVRDNGGTIEAKNSGGGWNALPTVLSGSATLDFPSTSAQSTSGLTITVTGAAVGDCVALGFGNASTTSGQTFTAAVTGANTVTVYFVNAAASAGDPPSAVFNVRVIK